jgi:hypothetical protein
VNEHIPPATFPPYVVAWPRLDPAAELSIEAGVSEAAGEADTCAEETGA